MATSTPVTAEQLAAMPDDGNRWELVAGELIMMTPAGWKHGAIAGRLQAWLASHVEENDLGLVFAAETGFRLSRNPDTIRAPDVAFVAKGRLTSLPTQEVFWPGVPDLAVEVVSPNDRARYVEEKVKAWLEAGCAMVWVVDPEPETVTVHRATGRPATLSGQDELSGEEVVEGFCCPVGALFAQLGGPAQ